MMTENDQPQSSRDPLRTQASPQPTPRIRLRAILLGIVLAVAICAITPYNNAYLQGTPLGGGHFPLAPFFVLVWLTIFVCSPAPAVP